VAENIALGMEDPPKPRDLAKRIHDVSRAYGLPLDPGRMVGDLSAGERQRVEIIRCLLQDPKLLIMDEPTSVLTPQEVEILFHTLRKLSAEGTAILYISHKLEEIRTLCDAATILRLGKVVATCTPREVSAAQMAEMMVGKSLSQPARAETEAGDVLLTVSGLTLEPASPFGTPLRHIGFEVRAGEILGIGGVAGNGQDELLAALSGRTAGGTGHDRVQGRGDRRHGAGGAAETRPSLRAGGTAGPCRRAGHEPDGKRGADRADAAGARPVGLRRLGPRPRLRRGDHRTLRRAHARARRGRPRAVRRQPAEIRDRAGDPASARGAGREPADVGRRCLAAAAIRQALLDLAQNGAAVVVISQDLDELLEVSDRFCALNEGRLSAPRPARGLSMEEIGLMLGGAHDMHEAQREAAQ
jgi:ABC-type uncharacterized transport system ATPase subunit